MKKNIENRLAYIDLSKGLGIMMITLGHITELDNPLDHWMSLFKISIFYFIAGYMLAYLNTAEKIKTTDYCKKHLKNLGIPYLLFSAVAIVLRALRAFLKGNSVFSQLKTDIFTTITLRGISTLWFIPTLIISSCIFFYLLKKKDTYIKYAFLLIPIIPIVVIYIWNRLPELNGVANNICLVMAKSLIALWFIGAGYCFYYLWKKYLSSNNTSLIVGLVGFAITFALAHYSRKIDFNLMAFGDIPIVFYVGGIVGSIASLTFFHGIEQFYTPKVLSYFGKNSLILMGAQRCFLLINIAQSGWKKVFAIEEVLCKRYYLECFGILIYVLLLAFALTEITHRLKPIKIFPFNRKD